jgi:hypothetical protein
MSPRCVGLCQEYTVCYQIEMSGGRLKRITHFPDTSGRLGLVGAENDLSAPAAVLIFVRRVGARLTPERGIAGQTTAAVQDTLRAHRDTARV